MKNLRLAITMLFMGICSSYAQTPTEPLSVDLIPLPAKMEVKSGYLMFGEASPVLIDKQFKESTDYILSELKEATDLDLQSTTVSNLPSISFKYCGEMECEEAYKLVANEKGVTIYSKGSGGVIYGLQTLKQLIELNNPSWNHKYIFVPEVTIDDAPRFEWRGFMLDVSRTYYSIDHVKKYVDYLVSLKLNRFHLHLSDDQGFRVEMKKYPNLNTVGSWRADRVIYDERDNSAWGRKVQEEGEIANYGGFYTREEIKDLVAYAKERNIEIVPEIDIPGHSQAIIASYPEFSCEPNKKFYVATGATRHNNTLCPSTEGTYEFVDAIIGEIAELFPFEYIHIGGDECSKQQWSKHDQCTEFKHKHGLKDDNELQSYFIHRVEEIVNSKGKKMIGWDEILDGGLAPNATVMSWRGEKGGIAAAKMGHKVVMSPSHSNYFDLKQGQADSEPNFGYAEALIYKTYNFKIVPDELTEEEGKYIIGNQANLWTETFASFKILEYMTFPRLYAAAENSWTPDCKKSWEGFVDRIKPHMRWMDYNGVRHAKSLFNPWMHHIGDGKQVKVWFTAQIENPEIRYTIDGTEPISTSPIYSEPITITNSCVLRAAIFEDGEMLGDIVLREFPIHKAAGAKVKVYSKEAPEGKLLVDSKFTDLSFGQFLQGGDTTWVDFKEDAEIEVLFDKPTDIESVSITTVRKTLGAIYPAKQIIVYGNNGGSYKEIGNTGVMERSLKGGRNLLTDRVATPAKGLKSIKIKVLRVETVPEGYQYDIVGDPTTLQIDEIVVR